MQLPTGEVPESYKIYFDQFENDPEGTLKKLEHHVSRRDSGAIGYYLLAALSRKAGDQQAALRFALTAKILAPGSTFFNRLPYFIQHPDMFEAWLPDDYRPSGDSFSDANKTDSNHPIADLDLLISKLSSAEKKRINVSESTPDSQDLSESSANVDDIVTETLAIIHENQDNYEAAMNVYKQLRLANKSKREYYERQILRLQNLQNKDDN